MTSASKRLRDLERRYNGPIPRAERDAVLHATPRTIRSAWERIRFYRRWTLQAIEASARWRAMAALAGQNLIRAVPPAGTMYIMLDIRATGLSGEAFAHRLLDECGIAVMPGESFGIQAAGHIRVAMTVGDEEFDTAFAGILTFAQEISDER